jgi:hypothetical protein
MARNLPAACTIFSVDDSARPISEIHHHHRDEKHAITFRLTD